MDKQSAEKLESWKGFFRRGAETLIEDIKNPQRDVYWGKTAILIIFLENFDYPEISETEAYSYLISKWDEIVNVCSKEELIKILEEFARKLK